MVSALSLFSHVNSCCPQKGLQNLRAAYSGNLYFLCRTPYPGGAPANVAAALGKLGASVGFITAFGNDELAKRMKSLLQGSRSFSHTHTSSTLPVFRLLAAQSETIVLQRGAWT